MILSAEVRSIGQRSAILSGAALVLRSLTPSENVADALPYLALTGTTNAALVTACAAALMTGYFLLRAYDEHLRAELGYSLAEEDSSSPSLPISDERSDRIGRIAELQGWVARAISIIDLWLPVALLTVVSIVLGPEFIDAIRSG